MSKYLIEFWPHEGQCTSVTKPDGSMWIVDASNEHDALVAARDDKTAPTGARIEKTHRLADQGGTDPEKLPAQP